MAAATSPAPLPFPPGPPPARNVIELFTHFRELERDLLGLVGQRFATYGDFLFANILGRKVYHACHPDSIYDVLVTQARAFRKRTIDLEVLGGGLLTSDGEAWRRHRRMIQPAFRHEKMLYYAELMAEETERFVARLVPGQVIELRSEMMKLTLTIVCRALFGQHFSGNGRKIARAMRVLWDPLESTCRHASLSIL